MVLLHSIKYKEEYFSTVQYRQFRILILILVQSFIFI